MSLTLESPLLLAAPAGLESSLEQHLNALTQLARERSGGDLVAVVLGGSLGRGEGVVLASSPEGQLLSDIDLYLVARNPGSPRALALRAEVRAHHESSGFSGVDLDLGVVAEGWFASLPPTLPAHQLMHGNRVLWSNHEGYRVELRHLDPNASDGVDRDDALCLLMNRFAEQLLLVHRLRSDPPDPLALYHRWKLYLDAPLAWLSVRGRYHPDRGEQRRRLASIWDGLGRPRPSWWGQGLELLEGMQRRLEESPLRLEELEALRPETEWDGMDAILEGLGEVRRGRIPELNWTWPFFRDAIRSALGEAHDDPGVGLQRAVEEGAPGTLDLVLALKWLRRRPLLSRLREARRWAPLAPRPVSPWYRHGGGGNAPERVRIACTLRFGGMNSWRAPLEDLVPSEELENGVPHRGEDLDLWLGRLWSGWVMGGSRG